VKPVHILDCFSLGVCIVIDADVGGRENGCAHLRG
jgi:hypothetical protein